MKPARAQYIGGLHSIRAALRHGSLRLRRVWYDSYRHDKRLRTLLEELIAGGLPATPATGAELDRLVAGARHQGIVVETSSPVAMTDADLEGLLQGLDGPPLLLVLDGVQDPHNLGACLRSADAAGVDAVIVPKDRAVGITPAVCKVASGAAETVAFVQVTNLARTLRWLRDARGVWVVGTAGEAKQSLFNAELVGPLALITGNEEKGLRRLTRQHCDQLVYLPMAGSVASLNVSVATGICLYEAVRQRSITQ